MPRFGPLLAEAVGRIESDRPQGGFLAAASMATAPSASGPSWSAENVSVTALAPRRTPGLGEHWGAYRDETLGHLERWRQDLEQMGIDARPLVSASALQFSADLDQLRFLRSNRGKRGQQLELLELDPLLHATALDDVPTSIELPEFHASYPDGRGEGVKVAVLDTGADLQHPHLTVTASATTCDEPIEVPGEHGTHCAGIIASRDRVFGGVAPGVELLNVKVGYANGRVKPGDLSRGFDEAADAGATIVSVSIGFNHWPLWATGGHGWPCPGGRSMCAVCRAVDTAVRIDDQLVVVAAGNEHDRADALRRQGTKVDTELCCPGQARSAVTVGSLSKRTHLPASSSSRGPGPRGLRKPDLCAPGVNITSTIPVPRGPDGRPTSRPRRSTLFGRLSGTSMATPVVAGVAALFAEQMRRGGSQPTAANLKRALMRAAAPLPLGVNAVGRGRATARMP